MYTLSLTLPDEVNTNLEAEIKKYPELNKSKSFYTHSKDLCGSLKGSSDLSTSATHLKGYGK